MTGMDQKEPEQSEREIKPAEEPGDIPSPLAQVSGRSAELFEEIRKKLEMAEAMKELFDEDKVEHHHGSAEPEGD